MDEDKFRINKQREEIKRLRKINTELLEACKGLLYVGKGCVAPEFDKANQAIAKSELNN